MPEGIRPKKPVSQRRRLQNQQAQRNYRERQKRHLELLQSITGYKNVFDCRPGGLGGSPGQDFSSGICTTPSSSSFSSQGYVLATSGVTPFGSVDGPSHTDILQHGSLIPAPTLVTSHENGVWTVENGVTFNSIDQSINEPLLNLPENIEEQRIIDRILQQETHIADENVRRQISENKTTLEDIIRAGLKALSQDSGSRIRPDVSTVTANDEGGKKPCLTTTKIVALNNLHQLPEERLPDLQRNNIRMKQLMFIAACDANASALGLCFKDDPCADTESSFYRGPISQEMATASCMRDFSHLKPYLQPTVSQLCISHHPYIDLLPFPTFRERTLKLISTDPPMIDEDDLCSDLEQDGLICWGSSLGGGSSAVGSGAPWDLRSWEAQSWFLKKWWILFGGKDGELYQQTQWWCEMRGERACYPW